MDAHMTASTSAVLGAPTPMNRSAAPGAITLKGSTERVSEFFFFAINSILYQTGIYEAESFTKVSKYWNPLFVTSDAALQAYLNEVIEQFKLWMLDTVVKKLVVVINSRETGETLQRWVFDVQVDAAAPSSSTTLPESQAELTTCQREIGALLRQITSTISFLPLMDTRQQLNFDVLIYTDKKAEVPQAWAETDPRYIAGEYEEVKLRSFSTKFHTVDSGVEYKYAGC